jgi:hypothetical protein
MDMMPSRLGSAQVRWNDYVGTAAADDADAVLDTRSLYEVAGLDRDRWTIVGIDFALEDSAEHVTIYAADRGEPDLLEADDQDLPVTAFKLAPSVQLSDFLREAFKRISVRLVSSVVAGRELVVAGSAQLSVSE